MNKDPTANIIMVDKYLPPVDIVLLLTRIGVPKYWHWNRSNGAHRDSGPLWGLGMALAQLFAM